ncbi:hypothetical protein [Actinoplanes sp. NPDC023714]|uniref:hypothetical protein n=1 Tax=Actinoplanes sp. NPDC023714 TaxID=3154322 RepID=UPI003409AD45
MRSCARSWRRSADTVADLGPLTAHLRATGWRVGGDHTAAKGGWRLTATTGADPEWEEAAHVRVERAAPAISIVLAVLLGVAGAVAGALLGRRPDDRRLLHRLATARPASPIA